MSKQSVTSKDDTPIAYWASGNGPPLVLVHGTPADHTRWRPLLPYLESHTTVHAMDRRGRGGCVPLDHVASRVGRIVEVSKPAV